jgi:hypothetical protein
MVTEPTLSDLQVRLFKEVPKDIAQKMLSQRPFGCSKIRLVPKQTGMRLITNLQSKEQIIRNGSISSRPGINSVLRPIVYVMNYEKVSV